MHSTESLPVDTTSRQPIMMLRIIVLALALGVVSFAAFAVAQSMGKPQVLAGKFDSLNLILLGVGITSLALGIILPAVIFASGRGSSPAGPATLAKTPEAARLLSIQQRIQTSTIIACALFEGGAFANVFGYMQTREMLHLILAGVLILGILARFPTAGAYQRRIDDELRRMQEDDAFKSAR